MSDLLQKTKPWIAKTVFSTISFDPLALPKLDRKTNLAQVVQAPRAIGDTSASPHTSNTSINDPCTSPGVSTRSRTALNTNHLFHFILSDGTHSISVFCQKQLDELKHITIGSLVRIRSNYWSISLTTLIRQYTCPNASTSATTRLFHADDFGHGPFCVVLHNDALSYNPLHTIFDECTITASSNGTRVRANSCIESIGCEGMGIIGPPIDVHSAVDVRRALRAIPSTRYRLKQIIDCFNYTLGKNGNGHGNSVPAGPIKTRCIPTPKKIQIGCFDEYPNKATIKLLVKIDKKISQEKKLKPCNDDEDDGAVNVESKSQQETSKVAVIIEAGAESLLTPSEPQPLQDDDTGAGTLSTVSRMVPSLSSPQQPMPTITSMLRDDDEEISLSDGAGDENDDPRASVSEPMSDLSQGQKCKKAVDFSKEIYVNKEVEDVGNSTATVFVETASQSRDVNIIEDQVRHPMHLTNQSELSRLGNRDSSEPKKITEGVTIEGAVGLIGPDETCSDLEPRTQGNLTNNDTLQDQSNPHTVEGVENSCSATKSTTQDLLSNEKSKTVANQNRLQKSSKAHNGNYFELCDENGLAVTNIGGTNQNRRGFTNKTPNRQSQKDVIDFSRSGTIQRSNRSSTQHTKTFIENKATPRNDDKAMMSSITATATTTAIAETRKKRKKILQLGISSPQGRKRVKRKKIVKKKNPVAFDISAWLNR